jgi:hypothetical protein
MPEFRHNRARGSRRIGVQNFMSRRISSLSACIATVAALMLGLSLGVAAGPLTPVQLATGATTDPTSVEPGTSFETAIVLEGATNTLNGIAAEHAYTRKHYPGWRWQTQGLMSTGGRHYDVIQMIGPKGDTKTIYFEITDWFGKLE